ncbi:universal stress protein [Lysinibacter cavernae]|uniref:Nucleotide-binding universal stress UspA family protein n=1 Tax=Lysinibacter cavernae TaxID=1640652 RepID=A0A7X5QZ43_9MICO|nr:universal stress protein [Lysinibacter cavernae]NIH52633.1 nucleotide-binding universal stress UspA family protein [Lysinibacter cavernae]
MTQRIVIGIDGSEPSRAAIAWGVERAYRYNAPVLLAHVVDDSFLSESPVFISEARAAAEQIVASEREYAESLNPNVPITTEIVVGNPAHEFQRLSEGSALVVLGTHKGSKVPGMFFGTKGIKIAAVSKSPVAIIPLEKGVERSGVVVGIDTSEASEKALAYAAAEADRTNQPLIAIYAWTPPVTPGLEYLWSDQLLTTQRESAESAIAIALGGLPEQYPDLKIIREVVQAPPVAALLTAAETAQLLVVGNRGRAGIARLLLGSVSHGVLQNVQCPTVVARTE